MATAAQKHEALAAEERLAAAPRRVDVDRGIGRQPGSGLHQERPGRESDVRHVTGSGPATATRPPACEVKSLTKKVSPPSERRSPLRRPPRVDVVIPTSPRVIAIAPASTRTLLPGGSVISPKANAGPELISVCMPPA